jgi:hypothetical protein
MLRRTRKPKDGGPAERMSQRRRRIVALIASFFVVLLLLLFAYLATVWMRELPPVDPRHARIPTAVALIRLDWSDDSEILLRAPLESLYRREYKGSLEFGPVWSALKFMVRPQLTLWIVPRESRASASTGRPAAAWVTALNLRRRNRLIDGRIHRLFDQLHLALLPEVTLSQPGVSPPPPDIAVSEIGIMAGMRGPALAAGTDTDLLSAALQHLGRAAQLAPDSSQPPSDPDPIWTHLPQDVPVAFVIQRPATWAPRLVRRLLRNPEHPILPVLSGSLPILLADAPRLIGEGRIQGPDTLVLNLTWGASADPSVRRSQEQALDRLLSRLRDRLPSSVKGTIEIKPLASPPPDTLGVTLTLRSWSALFAAARPSSS